jgi:hypothetical protein
MYLNTSEKELFEVLRIPHARVLELLIAMESASVLAGQEFNWGKITNIMDGFVANDHELIFCIAAFAAFKHNQTGIFF